MSAAQPTTAIDNERVRVTTWTFDADGANTGPHIHEYDYIVVPVTGGRFTVTEVDGTIHERQQESGVPYAGTAGTAHDAANLPGERAVFVEIELKR